MCNGVPQVQSVSLSVAYERHVTSMTVVSAQTTVEVPQLLEVPVENPQVQFLVKFNTPVVLARSPNVVSSAAQRGDGIFASSTCHCNIITLVHV